MRVVLMLLTALVAIPLGATAQEQVSGYRDGARRDFQAQGLRLVGASALSAAVYRFADPDAASDAIDPIVTAILDNLEATGGTMRPASAPDVGDEALAFAGQMATPDNQDITLTAGMVVWREGAVVRLLVTAAIAGDPLADAFTVARAIAGRTPVGETVLRPVRDGQMHQGGAWDLLPTLEDVPEGLVFTAEAPITGPGPATPAA